jgi:hypothetical protein
VALQPGQSAVDVVGCDDRRATIWLRRPAAAPSAELSAAGHQLRGQRPELHGDHRSLRVVADVDAGPEHVDWPHRDERGHTAERQGARRRWVGEQRGPGHSGQDRRPLRSREQLLELRGDRVLLPTLPFDRPAPPGRDRHEQGSNPDGGNYEPAIEIYTPPYLFDANDQPITTRPAITGISPAARVFGYNAPFSVTYTSASPISSAVLVRPGADTHGFDMDQRLIGLCGPSPQPPCSGSLRAQRTLQRQPQLLRDPGHGHAAAARARDRRRRRQRRVRLRRGGHVPGQHVSGAKLLGGRGVQHQRPVIQGSSASWCRMTDDAAARPGGRGITSTAAEVVVGDELERTDSTALDAAP